MIEAGRALDRLVGERVMGYTVRQNDGIYGTVFLELYAPNGKQVYYSIHEEQGTTVTCTTEDQAWAKCCPPFSTDLETAWTVVEALYAHDVRVTMSSDHATAELVWLVQAHNVEGMVIGFDNTGDSLPAAICRAALLAVAERRAA